MNIRFWGTRGSLATAGPETVRYGGNTACVEVRGPDARLVVLDAGSGIRALGSTLADAAGRIDISTTLSLHDRLTRYLSPPLFPVGLRDLASDVALHDVPTDQPIQLGSLMVTAALVIHPGPTVGYRLTDGFSTVAYLPDHEPAPGSRRFPDPRQWLSGFALAAGADLLIHGAQYTDPEYDERVGWGHSTLSHATTLAAAASVRRLATFHHDPSHDDRAIDDLLRSTGGRDFEVFGAREGMEVRLG